MPQEMCLLYSLRFLWLYSNAFPGPIPGVLFIESLLLNCTMLCCCILLICYSWQFVCVRYYLLVGSLSVCLFLSVIMKQVPYQNSFNGTLRLRYYLTLAVLDVSEAFSGPVTSMCGGFAIFSGAFNNFTGELRVFSQPSEGNCSFSMSATTTFQAKFRTWRKCLVRNCRH